MNLNIARWDSVKSTNAVAREILDAKFTPLETPPDVIVARKQTQGRGRSGNWFSPEDCGIYMSVIRSGNPHQIDMYTAFIGGAIQSVLAQHFQLILETRDINDIYLDGRKLAGILCEYHAASDKLIVGVGLNTFRPAEKKIRKDLLQSAVWLNEYSSEHLIDHAKLVNMIAEEITDI